MLICHNSIHPYWTKQVNQSPDQSALSDQMLNIQFQWIKKNLTLNGIIQGKPMLVDIDEQQKALK